MDNRTIDRILSLARDQKADAAEIFLRESTATTIEVKDQKVDAFERASERGAGLRVLVDGRPGFSFTTDLGEKGVAGLVHAAVTNARTVELDPFSSIPDRSVEGYHSVSTFDPAVVALTEAERALIGQWFTAGAKIE